MFFTDLYRSFHSFFETAGFFFVPILSLIGLFNLRTLQRGTGTVIFFLFAIFSQCVYLAATSGGRYLLIPLLLFGCLAGAGIDASERLARFLPGARRLPRHCFSLIAALCIVAVCWIRIVQSNHNQAMSQLGSILRRDVSGEATVFGVDCLQSRKLYGMLPYNKDITFVQCRSWEEAMQLFVPQQAAGRDFYFCVEMPKTYDSADYRYWFRAMYSLFPFDFLGEAVKGKKRYILYKFNRKVLASGKAVFHAGALNGMPETIPMTLWRSNWYVFFPEAFLPQIDWNSGYELSLSQGVEINRQLYSHFHEGITFKEGEEITLRNPLLWPEARVKRNFAISSENTPPDANLQSMTGAASQFSVSMDEPLMLCPESVPVLTSRPYLHLSGCAPLWRFENGQLQIRGGKEAINLSPECRTVDVHLEDTLLHTHSAGTFNIEYLDTGNLKNRDLSVLLISDRQSQYLQLQNGLTQVLSANSNIEAVTPEYGNGTSFITPLPELPRYEVQAIVLDVLEGCILSGWSVGFQLDSFFDEYLTEWIKGLRKQYPSIPILLVLPPPPTALPSMFPVAHSPQLGRLAHYRVCSAVFRWQQRNRLENVHLIPLFFVPDPENDYTVQWSIGQQKVRLGYHFTERCRRHMAELVAGKLSVLCRP